MAGRRLLLLCLLQIAGVLAEWEFCRFQFLDMDYHFSVPKSLEPGMSVGQVVFNNCSLKSNIQYISDDPHFKVQTNGSITVRDHMKIHGHLKIHVLAVRDEDVLADTTVTLKKRHPHHKQAKHEHHLDHTRHLKRQKRDWIIPPITVPENQRGPFPKQLVQVKSSRSKETKVYYSITGMGADSPPMGTFIIERETGWLNVTRPLDREDIATYTIDVHAVSANGEPVETPIEVMIKVSDQNDHHPQFTEALFKGYISEGSKPGTPVMNVTAVDLDDNVDSNNGIVWYYIDRQEPDPTEKMFTINVETGLISVLSSGLDRERVSQYTLDLKATDQEGQGYTATGKAIIYVTDANDNPPTFNPTLYTATIPENDVGCEVALLTVTDDDVPNTDAWFAEYTIIKGNEAKNFGVTTTPDNMGQIKAIKGLDFETKREYILLVTVRNKADYSVQLATSTATVTVTVTDVNEAPVFIPPVKNVTVYEDLPSGQEVASYTAQDPDKMQNQKITYYIANDPAKWLEMNPENGIITGNGKLDRESIYVQDNIYKAIVLAVDNGVPSATGTGTLQIFLKDVNDNSPYLQYSEVVYCQKNPDPLSITIIDRDQPPFTTPFRMELSREARENWTASVQDNQFEIKAIRDLDEGTYTVPVTLLDSQGAENVTTLRIQVCYCTAENQNCDGPRALAGGLGIPAILGILGAILALLILLLLLLLFVRRKKVVKEPLLPPDDEARDNVFCYDEEGGGEEDQDYDLGQIHRGLDARQDVTRNDVAPTLMPAPQYRPRPANPDEIGNFIDENLNAADNDPTAPPYDSLLVFDYEGSGSEAASLSTLNSSNSDEDQDYSALNNWGPRFTKLADMYGGDED